MGDQVTAKEAAPDDECDRQGSLGILPDQPYQHLQLNVRHGLSDDRGGGLVQWIALSIHARRPFQYG
ncbi:hypothetical protein [Streptomyces mirabilis]|uniref:hypothetical protein n=1 Tax=Streptomyces mirabilis TaxID=68239 RepID=UPI003690353F